MQGASIDSDQKQTSWMIKHFYNIWNVNHVAILNLEETKEDTQDVMKDYRHSSRFSWKPAAQKN